MKILIADDQELVLISMEKFLGDLGYTVKSATNLSDTIKLYDEFEPDLVICDLNMPVLPDLSGSFESLDYIKEVSGLEVVKYIKVMQKHTTPVMVLSGNNKEEIIQKAVDLGADDYMKKPLSLHDIKERIVNLIGDTSNEGVVNQEFSLIRSNCIAVVVLSSDLDKERIDNDYAKIVDEYLEYHICLINIGDANNLVKLSALSTSNTTRISVLDFSTKNNISEALRYGVLNVMNDKQFNYVGYIKPNGLVKFIDFHRSVNAIVSSQFKVLSGIYSNKKGVSAVGTKRNKLSKIFHNFTIVRVLKAKFQEDATGFQIYTRKAALTLFEEEFKMQDLYDIEVNLRIKKKWGLAESIKYVSSFVVSEFDLIRSKRTRKEYLSKLSQLIRI